MDLEKTFYSIAEVEQITGLPKHTLRNWEQRFRQVSPEKRNNRRYYRQQDIDAILEIRELVHEQGMGMKAVARRLGRSQQMPAPDVLALRLDKTIAGVEQALEKLKTC